MATRIAKKVGGAFPANATTTDATTRRTEKTDDSEKEVFKAFAEIVEAEDGESDDAESKGQAAEDIRSRRRLRCR